jgi:quercetin dioxygenase-like cupin family protein
MEMKRMAIMLSLTFVMGLVLGIIGTQVLNAQQEPVKRKVLLQTDLADVPGKEATLGTAEYAPGASSGKHYHPRHVLIYVLEGSAINEPEGGPPITLKQGDVLYESPKLVHNFKNASTTAPFKVLSCGIGEKNQPRVVPVE